MGTYGNKELLGEQNAADQPHIGKVIKLVMEKKRMKVADLKHALGRKGGAIYYILRQKYIPVPMLLRISELLDENLLEFYKPKISQPSLGKKEATDLREEIARLHEEMKLLKKENEIFREVLTLRKNT